MTLRKIRCIGLGLVHARTTTRKRKERERIMRLQPGQTGKNAWMSIEAYPKKGEIEFAQATLPQYSHTMLWRDR